MPVLNNTLMVRLTAEEYAALRQAAEADRRTVSALSRIVLSDWIKAQGSSLGGGDRAGD